MLVNFTFQNFRSYESLTNFTMVPGRVRTLKNNLLKLEDNKSLLKFAEIYGPNASGKSNLTIALKIAQEIITSAPEEAISWERVKDGSIFDADQLTRFEFDIQIHEKTYGYGFTLNTHSRHVETEWLYDLTLENKDQIIFSKIHGEKVKIDNKVLKLSKESLKRIEVYIDDYGVDRDSLFLSYISRNSSKIITTAGEMFFKDVYNWFNDTLEVISPFETPRNFFHSFMNINIKSILEKFLIANSTGIRRIDIDSASEDELSSIPKELTRIIYSDLLAEDKLGKSITGFFRGDTQLHFFSLDEEKELKVETVKFIHENEKKLSFKHESDGTKRLIELFSILASENPKVFVVDEIDRSMHPLLTQKFVKSFIEKNTMSQLIVTTHEGLLLDLNLLRRDQIWFVDKNHLGKSELFSLEQFKERFDKDINKAYFEGRYGAIPVFNSLSAHDFEIKEGE